MHVILVNGSPHPHGCTFTALETVAAALDEGGVTTEIFQVGTKPLSGCIACRKCAKLGRCVFDDRVNEFVDLAEKADGVISIGTRAGEGWLLTAEMVELIELGAPNIVCAQPFACLPNHVVGKGMFAELRRRHPEANIVSVDYDPGASQTNQLNRIKLMVATAHKRHVAAASADLQAAARRGHPSVESAASTPISPVDAWETAELSAPDHP